MLITVVILGKYMECQAKGKTSEAIEVRQWVGKQRRHAGRDVLAVGSGLVVGCCMPAVSSVVHAPVSQRVCGCW